MEPLEIFAIVLLIFSVFLLCVIVTQSEKKEKDYRALSIEIISTITPDLSAANEEMIYKIIAILQREDLNGK